MRNIFAICLLFWSSLVTAGMEDAVSAYKSGDYKTALQLFQEQAKDGDPLAQHNLGVMYQHGQGVPQNIQQSVKWYYEAANQGLAEAQYNLGVLYLTGSDLPRDFNKAKQLFSNAANKGFPAAQYNLGLIYAKGYGVRKDKVLAYQWFDLASMTGDRASVKNRNAVKGIMTVNEIKKAKRLVREWQEKHGT